MTNTNPGGSLYYFRRLPGRAESRRFVWHPEVHLLYHERCYFFFVSAPDPSLDLSLSEQIVEVMASAEVESYSLYELFGTFDVLIRVWATGSAAIRITTAIEAIASDDFLLLEVSGISYTFFKGVAPSRIAITDRRSRVVEISERERRGGWTASDVLPEPIQDCISGSLAIEVPAAAFADPTSGQGVKVYLILERRSALRSRAQLELELAAFQEALSTAAAQCSTIYELRNDRGYILKTIVEDFNSVRESLIPVYAFSVRFGFRSQTFPIASVLDSREADLIDASVRDDSWQTEDVVVQLESLLPTARTFLGALAPRNRETFVRFLQQSPSPFLSTTLIHDLAELLEGMATSDTRSIKRGLGFVLEVEDDLRAFLEGILKEAWGSDWRARYDHLQSEESSLPAAGVDADDPFEAWAFQEVRIATGVLASKHDELRDAIVKVLGADFRQRLDRVRDLRNQVAHRFGGVIDGDGAELARYLEAADVFLRLEDRVAGERS